MNITKEQIDDLNALVKVEIVKEDYSKKQYGMPVRVDEVNKMLQEGLSKFLTEEKLDVLGNPLPKNQDDFNWDLDDYVFEFELGIAPKFDVNITPKKAINSYKIKVDDKMVENQVTTIRKQYGKIVSQTEVAKNSEVSGTFLNEEAGIDNKTTFEIAELKGKKNTDAFLGAKPGDVIKVKTKSLFAEAGTYQNALKISRSRTF